MKILTKILTPNSAPLVAAYFKTTDGWSAQFIYYLQIFTEQIKQNKGFERVQGESIDSITLKKYFVRRKSKKQNIRLVSIPFETRTCHLWRTLIATTTTFISEHPRSRHDKTKFLSREGHTEPSSFLLDFPRRKFRRLYYISNDVKTFKDEHSSKQGEWRGESRGSWEL